MDRREALVQGGKTRFRPVILTALTTALGLVPLAGGLNLDFFGLFGELNPDLYWGGDQASWWGPMAIAVIVGIIFATFLTLVLVPVMYSLVDDVSAFFRRHFVTPQEVATSESVDGQEGVGEEVPGLERVPDVEPVAV
jgi:predicted RND superfamily exporter protein